MVLGGGGGGVGGGGGGGFGAGGGGGGGEASSSNKADLAAVNKILHAMQKDPKFAPFLRPVVETYPELKETYPKQVEHPMDFSTVSDHSKSKTCVRSCAHACLRARTFGFRGGAMPSGRRRLRTVLGCWWCCRHCRCRDNALEHRTHARAHNHAATRRRCG